MNRFLIVILKVFRKVSMFFFGAPKTVKPDCEQKPNIASTLMMDALLSDAPCMIARLGSNEARCLCNYLAIKSEQRPIRRFIKGEAFAWWWEPYILKQMHVNAGFFPPTTPKIERFCELMLKDLLLVDILGSWLPEERILKKELDNARKIRLELLNPYLSDEPWTKALVGKKVLVIHPFSETIKKQFLKKDLIFPNGLLPDFELKTVKAVQSIADSETPFSDWFEALNYMKSEMDKVDYDVCLIGCGAYGLSLAAHAKQMGKKSVHMGGALQLLFGIKGKRWENPNYSPNFDYTKLMNIHWVKPSVEETPPFSEKVEGACYW